MQESLIAKPFSTPSIKLGIKESLIIILGGPQLLCFYHQNKLTWFHISTSKLGFGEENNSFKTPRGWHYIRAIIGKNNPKDTAYIGRRITQKSDITGRILWLCGLEPHNHDPKTHSMYRYIYIHGVPNAFKKQPSSSGCINMRNQDIKWLADHLPKYCKTLILAG